jgi:YfiH family protein
VGDDPAAVAANRAALARSLPFVPADPSAWVWLRQVHGREVAVVDAPPPAPPDADAAVTSTVGLPLVVLTADCAPIALVADGAVGVVHAGWQGLERGVIGAAVAALRTQVGDPAAPVRAWLGPCIHAAHYEFGEADLARLVARFGPVAAGRTAAGTPAFDLPAAVVVALREAGVGTVDADVCTAESADHFSYRRDGVTGRQAVVVVRTP